MINKLRIRATLLASLVLAPVSAMGFDNSIPNGGSNRTLGNCGVYLYYNSDQETARIFIKDKNYNYFVPGGTYFDYGNIYTLFNAFSASLIADCLGTNAGNISNFQQDGADGMFASDTYVGFSFTLATSAGGLSAGNHEFAYSSVPADTTAPVITPPSAQTANTDPDKDYASLDVTSLGSASDNVDGSVSIT